MKNMHPMFDHPFFGHFGDVGWGVVLLKLPPFRIKGVSFLDENADQNFLVALQIDGARVKLKLGLATS